MFKIGGLRRQNADIIRYYDKKLCLELSEIEIAAQSVNDGNTVSN